MASPPPPRPPLPAWLADLGLAGITAIWGWSFVLVRDGVAVYPVFPFLALRFTLALAIIGLFLFSRLRHLDKPTLAGGAAMGVALFAGYSFQTTGMTYTSAAHAGFITGLFVVFTPVFEAILLRAFPPFLTWVAVGVSCVGLALLAAPGGFSSLNFGDFLCFLCALVYACHILITARQAAKHDTACLAVVQIGTVAALAWIGALPRWEALWPVPGVTMKAIVLTAFLATALAYFAQTAFQKFTTPTRTAFLFTLEPIFAGIFAVWVGGERLDRPALLGGGLIVAGMLLQESSSLLRPRKGAKSPVP